MTFYYAGFNTSMLFSNNGNIIFIVDSFTKVPFSGITGFQIGWNYFLIWKGKELYISQKFEENNKEADSNFQLIQPLEKPLDSINQAAIGKDKIILLFDDNEIWQYKIYEKTWKKVINFICNSNDSENEYPVKIIQEECAVVLTNLGRVFNIPTLIDIPKRIRFIDIACGFDHTILLAENGDLYSMGMGTRGQLGHNDLEDCDNPKLVEALAGIKVTQISAAGWHSAVVTNQGDLYTWGWNTNGELGLTNQESKVIAVPTLIDFTNDKNESVEIFVEKAQCGNTFTICMTNDGTFWGCGCNKYGQLGQSPEKLANSMKFIKLDTSMIPGTIKDFKCREWGTILITN
ncbi:E3 ISG15--protein ligase Herc6 isoform X1 [Apis cerana]|uniref:E3 ISG15--protein ligase Herc6 isoform X1 n=1 Tax=Apis cerana TaxID=7461 RepID=UPI0007E2C89E|nr:E3 ISG15--protein ligase Herc6 isoform X1 [Apis cerana]